MFKRTPCYGCDRPERLPNGLCEKGCKVKADYMAEKAEYLKREAIERGLDQYADTVIERCRKKNKKFKHGGNEL